MVRLQLWGTQVILSPELTLGWTVGSSPDTVGSNPDTVGSSPAVTLEFSPDKGGWMVLGQTGSCSPCWGLSGASGPHWDWSYLGTAQGQRGDAGPHRESSM